MRRDVFDPGSGGKQVLRETDAAAAQVGLNLFVLPAVEAVGIEERLQTPRRASGQCLVARQQIIEKALYHAGKFWNGAARGGESFQFAAPNGRKQPRLGAEQRRHHQPIVFRGHDGRLTA